MNEKIPTATYRMQFHAGFTFDNASRVVPYLQQLGISALYSSPIATARPGSTHGYDVVDPGKVNPELGGEQGLQNLSARLQESGLGLVVDIVPNHMGVLHESNQWWWDVLENGPGSPYADFFDIDWHPPKQELQNRVCIATLGQQFGVCLEAGELKVQFTDDGIFIVRYYDKSFPTAPRTWTTLLLRALEKLKQGPGGNLTNDHLMEFESIITGLHNLPLREDTEPEKMIERQREKEVAKRRLRALISEAPDVHAAIHGIVDELNGKPGDPASFDALEQFLKGQAYRLSFWRTAPDEINYRRFFDVNELAAIRVELPQVFKSVHAMVFRLIQEGIITGLRVDHPDGLFNPPQYFSNLQHGCHMSLASRDVSTSEFPAHERDCAMWVVVEKILALDERLREDWVVHGTTGYDYLNAVNRLFVNGPGERPLLKLYAKFTGTSVNFKELMNECKKLILDVSMSGELVVLARRLDRISEQHRRTRDFTLSSLQDALAEVIAGFPVYRSYIRPDSDRVSDDDRRHIVAAIRAAKRRNPSVDPTIYDFIGSVLLLEDPEGISENERFQRRDFVLRLQQFTGPVMAKGLEDTAFYREYPLLSLNEVGGEPEKFGISVDEFHRRCADQFQNWPHTMLSTSTHDTKRSEDVRARINVLSEIPREWERAALRWRQLNRKRKVQVDGIHVPTSKEEYMLYQTLVGVWPLDPAERAELPNRLKEYIIKASREAKVHTSWVNVNSAHEDALKSFIDQVLDPGRGARFIAALEEFHSRVAGLGALNSLSQVLLKATCPGVPDFYQGTELWDFSMVDPDNRRPVDYDRRIQLLDSIRDAVGNSEKLQDIVQNWRDGRVKMHVVARALNFRREHESLFSQGAYIPLTVGGDQADSIIAFARKHNNQFAVTVVPRFLARAGLPAGQLVMPDLWNRTTIRFPNRAPETWRNEMTGETVQLLPGSLELPLTFLSGFPVALLSSAVA
jgi:(1->4)-alpha-D-glucan 1-alpha-D-glucosylmutase